MTVLDRLDALRTEATEYAARVDAINRDEETDFAAVNELYLRRDTAKAELRAKTDAALPALLRIARAAEAARTALSNAQKEATHGATASVVFIDQCVDSAARALTDALSDLEANT